MARLTAINAEAEQVRIDRDIAIHRMHAEDDMSPRQIADLLRMSVSNVRLSIRLGAPAGVGR